MDKLGQSYYDVNSDVAVAGVDTLLRRRDALAPWLKTITLWVQDEAHHILNDNKWGKVVSMMPAAVGLGVTATPTRADGRGLGGQYDGVMDQLIVGPNMRDIINDGYLTDYRIFAPKTEDLDLSTVPLSKATGDYTQKKLFVAVRKSRIIGDVVEHYQRIAPGQLGITFATDVQTCMDIADKFRAAGVPARALSYESTDRVRAETLDLFAQRKILQIVNVDILGEGFDVPGVQVVSMARPTKSYGVYVQQFGRGLRILDDNNGSTARERRQNIAASIKPHAIIIDHVGNVEEHRLPDRVVNWTLARKRRKQKLCDIPIITCSECGYTYEAIQHCCPDCGYVEQPTERSAPQFVHGDLTELDAAALARLRGEVAQVDMTGHEYRANLVKRGCPHVGVNRNVRRHLERQEMQQKLRKVLNMWGAKERASGVDDRKAHKIFYYRFGVDTLTARTLGTAEAQDLGERIIGDLL
jgi:superfamily II DNA or RNA helicase